MLPKFPAASTTDSASQEEPASKLVVNTSQAKVSDVDYVLGGLFDSWATHVEWILAHVEWNLAKQVILILDVT